jgi:hypothetical protein
MWEGLNYIGALTAMVKVSVGPYLPQAPNSTSKFGILTQIQFRAYVSILCDNRH